MLPQLSQKQLSPQKYQFAITLFDKVIGKAIVLKSRKIKISNLLNIDLPQESWVLDEIEIQEDLRGKNYGSQLLQYVINYTQNNQRIPIVLIPPASDYTFRILKWYRRHKFRPTPQGYWCRVMSNE